jgi:hypothetical protein
MVTVKRPMGSQMRCLLSLAGFTALTVGGLAASAGLLGLGMLGGAAWCCRPRRQGGPKYL